VKYTYVVVGRRNEDRQAVEQAIIDSARREIETNGILGLRVADVAAGAHYSLTQVYRYFGDRDGLLARVLGDLYDEILTRTHEGYMAQMKTLNVITLDDIVNSLPTVSKPQAMLVQEIRLQILATSVKNVELRERIEDISRDMYQRWESGLDYIESKLEPGLEIDRRVFTIMLIVQMMYYRTLLGDIGFSDDEYRDFVRDKLVVKSHT
jgi:AcrR family transcriptional regulator